MGSSHGNAVYYYRSLLVHASSPINGYIHDHLQFLDLGGRV